MLRYPARRSHESHCARYWSPNCLRMVPASAFAGSVAPMIFRSFSIALSASRTIGNDRTFGHEFHQAAEKRPLLVNMIKALRLLLRSDGASSPRGSGNPLFRCSLMTPPALPAVTVSGLRIVNVFCIFMMPCPSRTCLSYAHRPYRPGSSPRGFLQPPSPPFFLSQFPSRPQRSRRRGPCAGPEARSDRR